MTPTAALEALIKHMQSSDNPEITTKLPAEGSVREYALPVDTTAMNSIFPYVNSP